MIISFITKRRHGEGKHIESVIEITAEVLLAESLVTVLMWLVSPRNLVGRGGVRFCSVPPIRPSHFRKAIRIEPPISNAAVMPATPSRRLARMTRCWSSSNWLSSTRIFR